MNDVVKRDLLSKDYIMTFAKHLASYLFTISLAYGANQESLPWVEEAFHQVPNQLISFNIPCSDEYLNQAGRHPNLEKIAFYAHPRTPQPLNTFDQLRSCPLIKELTIRGIYLDLPQAEVLSKFPLLQTLDLNFSKITPEAWTIFAHLQNLQSLSLSGVGMTNDQLEFIKPLRANLTSIHLASNMLTSASGSFLSNCYWLNKIIISDNLFGDEGVKDFQFILDLKELSADRCGLSDKGVEALSQVSTLQYLSVAGNSLTDASVPHLKRLKNLIFLDVSECGLTLKALEQLASALPNTKILGFPTDHIKNFMNSLNLSKLPIEFHQ